MIMRRPMNDESMLKKLHSVPTNKLRPEFLDNLRDLKEFITKFCGNKSLLGQELDA